MAETSVYYVPENQAAWRGRRDDLAERMWKLGVFLLTSKILERLQILNDNGQPLPDCDLDIREKYGDMGVEDALHDQPVPNSVYDIQCPSCSTDLTQDAQCMGRRLGSIKACQRISRRMSGLRGQSSFERPAVWCTHRVCPVLHFCIRLQ